MYSTRPSLAPDAIEFARPGSRVGGGGERSQAEAPCGAPQEYRGGAKNEFAVNAHGGACAEYLVCADLWRAGHIAFLAASGLPYDLVLDVGTRLLRVQVKSTGGPTHKRKDGQSKGSCYRFGMAKSGKGYIGRVDLFAFMAWTEPAVLYRSAQVLYCFHDRNNKTAIGVTKFRAEAPGSLDRTLAALRVKS